MRSAQFAAPRLVPGRQAATSRHNRFDAQPARGIDSQEGLDERKRATRTVATGVDERRFAVQ